MHRDRTFYAVKIAFPRGDAACLLLGLDPEGKITGIGPMSMAVSKLAEVTMIRNQETLY